MARLMRGLAAFLALLSACSAAIPEPISASIAAWYAAASAVTVLTTALTILSVASSIYGAIQTKKKQKAALARQAEIEAANLKDRTATLVTSDSPWPVIYGSPAPVGGSIVATLTSGDRDQFKHVVMIVASHECDAIEAVYAGGDWVGNLSPAGWADGEQFQLTDSEPQVITVPFELVEYTYETDQGTVRSGIGYWSFNAPFGAFSGVQSILDENSNDLSATVTKGVPPNLGGGDFLIGPIGAKGTVAYWIASATSALNVQVHLSPGGVDTADAFLRTARPDLWTVDHKLSGYTYVVLTMNLLLERFQGGVQEFTFKVRGKKVYDPRTGQRIYSRNNALCLADFITSEAGYRANFATQVEQDTLVASANACDVAVYDQAAVDSDPASYGGSRARYTCDGMFRSDQDRDTTRQQIEDSMLGFSLESGGVWRIIAGAWTTPVMSLNDDDMLAPTSVVQTASPGTGHFNGVKGTYVNATRNGVTEDFTPYQNPTFRALDERDKFQSITLSFTGAHVRTQQIGRVMVEQSRGGMVIVIHPKMFAWGLQPGDRIVVSCVLYGFGNKPFKVQDWTYSNGSPLAIQCVEDEESMYDLADETRADPASNTNLPNPLLKPGAPLDLVVLSGESQMVQQDGVMVIRAKAQWAQTTDRYVLQGGIVRVQWRLAGDAIAWQSVDLPGDASVYYILGLAVNNVYVVRVQFLSSYAVSGWSYAQHELHGLEGPPDSVLGLDVLAERTGIYAYWQEPAGIDLLGWSATQIRRGPSWELAEGTVLFDGRASSANLGWFPAGSQAVWASHHNTIGEWSEPVYDTIEILPPAQPIPTAVVNNRNQVSIAWVDCKTTQPIDFYEIRLGATYAAATLVGQARGTTFETVQPSFGEHRYWVTAVDVAGNRGASGYSLAVTLQSLASEIGSLRGKVSAARDEIAAMQLAGDIIAFDQLGAAKAGLYEKIDVTVTDTKALVVKYTALSAEVGENQAIVVERLEVLATEQEAHASSLELVAATTGQNTAAIAEERVARTDQYGALASDIETTQSSVGELSATVEERSETLASLSGNVAAQYMVRAEAIGPSGKRALAGLSLGVSAGGPATPTQSEVIVFADNFYFVIDPIAGTLDAPFRIEGGIVYINIAKIKDADIGTLKVGGDALSTALGASGTGVAAVSFTVPVGQIWRAVSTGFSGNGPEQSLYTAYLLLTGGTTVSALPTVSSVIEGDSSNTYLYRTPPIPIGSLVDYGPGPHTVTLRAAFDSGGTSLINVPVVLLVTLQKRGA